MILFANGTTLRRVRRNVSDDLSMISARESSHTD